MSWEQEYKHGIEAECERLVKLINQLRSSLALEDEPVRRVRYEEQLKDTEDKLTENRQRLDNAHIHSPAPVHPLAPPNVLQWSLDTCLRPVCTRTVLHELLVRRQSVNLTGDQGHGKSRLLHDLKVVAADQELRVALLSLKDHRLQYTNFLRATAMQLALAHTDYTDIADLVSDLSLRRDTPCLLLLDEIEVLNEYPGNDPRYNDRFVASLNLLKDLDHLHLLCASREWLKAVVFNGETSLLTLHPMPLPPLSQQEIQAELHRRLPEGHELLRHETQLAQARAVVQAATQPCTLLERLISRVQLGYAPQSFDHLLKELGDGKR